MIAQNDDDIWTVQVPVFPARTRPSSIHALSSSLSGRPFPFRDTGGKCVDARTCWSPNPMAGDASCSRRLCASIHPTALWDDSGGRRIASTRLETGATPPGFGGPVSSTYESEGVQ